MEVIRSIEDIRKIVYKNKFEGKKIALVPTMGFLHDGHKSLMKAARKDNDIVIVSVFVNPTQFGPNEDYDSYPRDIERDSKICESEGVDYIFTPDPEIMYPDGYSTFVLPGEHMTNILCGVSRPGHFRGVCTVLTKLFNIISPNNAYFGEKDIQQLGIIRRMVKDFNYDINIIGCPIVREDDGLAKSSRNVYLNSEEREIATVLRKSLLKADELIKSGEKDVLVIKNLIEDMINSEKYTRIDYVEIIDFDTFNKIEKVEDKTLIVMAVYVGKTRLIDNIVI